MQCWQCQPTASTPSWCSMLGAWFQGPAAAAACPAAIAVWQTNAPLHMQGAASAATSGHTSCCSCDCCCRWWPFQLLLPKPFFSRLTLTLFFTSASSSRLLAGELQTPHNNYATSIFTSSVSLKKHKQTHMIILGCGRPTTNNTQQLGYLLCEEITYNMDMDGSGGYMQHVSHERAVLPNCHTR